MPMPAKSVTIRPGLNYVKLILAKVSFDASLFQKELRKALTVLLPEEIRHLKEWCYRQFGGRYGGILDECFAV